MVPLKNICPSECFNCMTVGTDNKMVLNFKKKPLSQCIPFRLPFRRAPQTTCLSGAHTPVGRSGQTLKEVRAPGDSRVPRHCREDHTDISFLNV